MQYEVSVVLTEFLSVVRSHWAQAAGVAVIVAAWLIQRRRAWAQARWVAYASGKPEYARALLVVARGSARPAAGLAAVAACGTVEEILRHAPSRYVDRLLLWRAPATEEPVPFSLTVEESTIARARRLRDALEVTPEEEARPPAVRRHHERHANRDVAAFIPLFVILGSALVTVVLVIVDPFATAEPQPDLVAQAVETVCTRSTALCDGASLARQLLERNQCSEALDEANRLAVAFAALPDAARTEALERALNVVHERARRCRSPSTRPGK